MCHEMEELHNMIEGVVAMAPSPDYHADGMAFAATKDGALWCTADRGRRWESVLPSSQACRLSRCRVVRVAVSPCFSDDALVLAGADDGTVARSLDSGWTWEVIARVPGPVAGFVFSSCFEHDRRVSVAATEIDIEIDADIEVGVPVSNNRSGPGLVAA